MAFAFQEKESAAEGIRRILRERLSSASDRLKDSRKNPEEAVHEARKDLKKIRSTLRLLRPHLGEARFRKENHRYRDVGRVLSQVRDAHILQETLEKLKKHFAAEVPAASLKAAEKKLAERISHSEAAIFGDKEVLPSLAAALRRGEEAFDTLDLDALDWKRLRRGLRKVFKGGKRAREKALAENSAQAFHEWRKEVKHLRYPIEILEPAWPETLGTLAAELRKLSDLLGEDHDLHVLDDFLGSAGGLHSLIVRRQKEIRREATSEGERLYSEKARAFAERIFSYVDAWRATDKAGPAPKRENPTGD